MLCYLLGSSILSGIRRVYRQIDKCQHMQRRAWEMRQRSTSVHRWIDEVAHSWFNRFRKLLVRYEKLERSYLALYHLAAAIIVFRKVPMKANIIYG